MASSSETQFTILIDGDCPLCVREAAMMRKMDKGRGRLEIVDLTAPDFDPDDYGKTWEDVTGRIHGVKHDGTVIEGVEVFREAYDAVGWGWMVAWTKWPILRPIADWLYVWFAKHRYSITLRKNPCDAGGSCKLPT